LIKTLFVLPLLTGVIAVQTASVPNASADDFKVVSERTVSGFGHPESVGCDARRQVLYVGDFGPELKPADKDGKGRINKVSLDGKIIEAGFLPTAGQVLNKPKGIWISGNRLWVTDIDSVWVFDLATKEGKKLDLPGITFANDPAVLGNALYVSDNRSDQLVRIEPADFLNATVSPKITTVFAGKGINPNGIYPGKGGVLLMAGFKSKDEPRGIYSLAPGKEPQAISDKIGMLDGLYQTENGDILATDWGTSSLFRWSANGGLQKLAGDFKGPADFCVIPNGKELTVFVPDLVKGEIRIITLAE
jgi:hypothetical protein